MCPLTLSLRLHCRFQVLHCAEQAALEYASTATLPHDPDAALSVHFGGRAAVLIVRTDLTQSPTPLLLALELLGFTDHITAGL